MVLYLSLLGDAVLTSLKVLLARVDGIRLTPLDRAYLNRVDGAGLTPINDVDFCPSSVAVLSVRYCADLIQV
jgi:hypothetical protein